MFALVMIGNSDDKMSQFQWSELVARLQDLWLTFHVKRHGEWFSAPASRYQNACWLIQLDDNDHLAPELKGRLKDLAREFDQDAIAWYNVGAVELLSWETVSEQDARNWARWRH